MGFVHETDEDGYNVETRHESFYVSEQAPDPMRRNLCAYSGDGGDTWTLELSYDAFRALQRRYEEDEAFRRAVDGDARPRSRFAR